MIMESKFPCAIVMAHALFTELLGRNSSEQRVRGLWQWSTVSLSPAFLVVVAESVLPLELLQSTRARIANTSISKDGKQTQGT
jgi:hypothetical protein